MADRESGVVGLDHVQLAMPEGAEEAARGFYGGVLGMAELPKPAALAARGGCWFRSGAQAVHLGVEREFRSQKKAHPALLVPDLAALRERLRAAGAPIVEDDLLPGYTRFYTEDPFGNRIECLWPLTARPTAQAVKERVQATFGPNAEAYVQSQIHAQGPDLALLVEWAAPVADDLALDVSTGGGHTALAMAPHVGHVTVSDLTPSMLAAARRFITSSGITNADYVIADAERLPFLDESFSLVTVRIAPHHYADIRAAVAEMARVLTPGGRLALVDNLAPEDPALDAALNEWEVRRDPSHVRNYTQSEWLAFLAQAGLRVTRQQVLRREHEYRPWVERLKMPEDEAARLEADMLASSEEARRYFALTERDGRLDTFTTDFLVALAIK